MVLFFYNNLLLTIVLALEWIIGINFWHKLFDILFFVTAAIIGLIAEHSENSDIVLLGIPKFSERKSDNDIIENINLYTEKLKVSLIVQANDKIDFRVN